MQVTGHHEQHLKETDAKLNSTKTARRNSRLPRGSLILPWTERGLNWQQDKSGPNWPNCAAICTILHRATSISYSLCIIGKNVPQSDADTDSDYFISIKLGTLLRIDVDHLKM